MEPASPPLPPTENGSPPAPAAVATAEQPAKKPRQKKQPQTLSLPTDTVSPEPDAVPSPPPKATSRRVKNTELIVMHDCWDLLDGMPTPVQRRIVQWLDSQVKENEKADEQAARMSVPQ